MSKLLRLPLTLLAVLAAVFFLPGIAFGDPPPTTEQCAAEPTLEGCPATPAGEVVDPAPVGGEVVGTPPGDGAQQPVEQPVEQPEEDAATPPKTEDTPSLNGQTPAGGGLTPPAGGTTRDVGTPVARAAVELPAEVATPAPICETVPTFPGCPGAPPAPAGPLSCDDLADLLGLPSCPDNFSCDQLAELLGITDCPTGAPTCEDLAALFGLEGCPAPPTSCQEFADLLGIDNCSQIPCLDTSQLPNEARDGLGPLLDGLENIGIKECPAKPATGGNNPPPGRGTYMPNPPAAAPQQVYYANCDDARAHGATNIPRGTPGYRPELDSDNDGYACEAETQYAVSPMAAQPTGKLAYTGVDLESQLTVAWTLVMAGSALALIARRRA
jgi:hypothetical protein